VKGHKSANNSRNSSCRLRARARRDPRRCVRYDEGGGHELRPNLERSIEATPVEVFRDFTDSEAQKEWDLDDARWIVNRVGLGKEA